MSPSFSVVLPLYNKAPFVARTLASVARQTVAPFEIIVVDDGSTDESASVVNAITDKRVRMVRQENAGPGAARNRGVLAARASWIALLDADDLWRPNHLETLAQVVAAFPKADLVGTGWKELEVELDEHALALEDSDIRSVNFFAEPGRAPFYTSSVAIRRQAFNRTNGFTHERMGEDSAFWIRFALEHSIAVSSRKTVIYRRGTNGLMEQARVGSQRNSAAWPELEALAEALSDPRYTDQHAEIAKFDGQVRRSYARGELYRGQGRKVRRLLAEQSKPMIGYRLLSFLPGSVLRAAARQYSSVKRRIGH